MLVRGIGGLGIMVLLLGGRGMEIPSSFGISVFWDPFSSPVVSDKFIGGDRTLTVKFCCAQGTNKATILRITHEIRNNISKITRNIIAFRARYTQRYCVYRLVYVTLLLCATI